MKPKLQQVAYLKSAVLCRLIWTSAPVYKILSTSYQRPVADTIRTC